MIWYENPLIVSYLALISALAIDIFNLRLLLMLWDWSQHAGKNLIDQVRNALNLKNGGDSPLKDQIIDSIKSGNLQENIRALADANPEMAQEIKNSIDPNMLLSALITGELKLKDIKGYLPLFAANILKEGMNNSNNGGSSSGPGHW